MLRKLEVMGYLTIEGEVAERVLPTVAAIGGRTQRSLSKKPQSWYESSSKMAYRFTAHCIGTDPLDLREQLERFANEQWLPEHARME